MECLAEPDYKNAHNGFYGGAELLEEGGKQFADNMRNYYHYATTNDKVLTHSLLNPTVNFELSKQGKSDKDVSLKVVKENDAGIFVTGARLLATLGPQADEVEVFPSTLLNRQKGSDLEYAFAFVAPVASPGLKMICRDTYDHAKSHYDAPLSSRYEEMDAVVIFKDVFVPWESFHYREPDLCNRAFAESCCYSNDASGCLWETGKSGIYCRFTLCNGKSVRQRQRYEYQRSNCRSHVYDRNIEITQIFC